MQKEPAPTLSLFGIFVKLEESKSRAEAVKRDVKARLPGSDRSIKSVISTSPAPPCHSLDDATLKTSAGLGRRTCVKPTGIGSDTVASRKDKDSSLRYWQLATQHTNHHPKHGESYPGKLSLSDPDRPPNQDVEIGCSKFILGS